MAHRIFGFNFNIVPPSAEESDVLLCVGVCAIFCGLWWIYPPAGLIFTGIAFLVLAYLTARAEQKP